MRYNFTNIEQMRVEANRVAATGKYIVQFGWEQVQVGRWPFRRWVWQYWYTAQLIPPTVPPPPKAPKDCLTFRFGPVEEQIPDDELSFGFGPPQEQ